MSARLTGEWFTYLQLWRTAKSFYKAGTQQRAGSLDPLLAAVVFAYFAFEALMNELLRELAPEQYANERAFFAGNQYRGTLGKLDYLAQLCGLPIDKSRTPYQSVKDLQKARDYLVHAKTELFDEVVPVDQSGLAVHPESQLDRYANAIFVERSLRDVEAVCDALVARARAKYGPISVGSDVGAFSGVERSYQAVTEPGPRADV